MNYIIGEKLKKMRVKCGYTIKEIAEFLDITTEEYKQIEYGEAEAINAFFIEKLCILYWADLSYMKAKKPEFDIDLNALYCINKIIKNMILLEELMNE